MFDFIDGGDAFQLRVFDDQFLNERLVQRDVNVLVDRCGDEKTAVFPVVGGQVGAAAT